MINAWGAMVSLAAVAASAAVSAQVNVTTYHNDNARTGQNLSETQLNTANVSATTFGLLFSQPVDGQIYAQPLYVSGVETPNKGVHNVVFVATEHNSVYAFDADTDQSALWKVSLGPSMPAVDSGSNNITTEIGVTSTPVIQLTGKGTGTLYVVAITKELNSSNQYVYYHRLHALNIATGAEQPGSPVIIQASVPGTGDGNDGKGHVVFNSRYELQRPALMLLNVGTPTAPHETVFICFGSNDDNGPYHGWIMGYDATTLKQSMVLNITPNALTVKGSPPAGGAIWQSGAGPSSDGTSIYVVVANGTFNPSNGSYGDSVLRLNPQANLAVEDYFTPFNQASLNDQDLDLGSGGPLLLPPQVGSKTAPNLLVTSGKEGRLYLLNTQNLGKYGSTDHVVQEFTGELGPMYSMGAYFSGKVYFCPRGYQLLAFPVANGTLPSSGASMKSKDRYGYPGATPSVSANGNADAIVWTLQTDAYSSKGPVILHAYDATNLQNELYRSDSTGGRDTVGVAVKFSVPTVASGKVYAGSATALGVFGLGAWVSAPLVTPAGGNYTGAVAVSMTDSTAGSKIYYTTNGSVPTTSSTLYTKAITIQSTTTLTARAFATGYQPSAPVVENYSISNSPGTGTGLEGSYFNDNQTAEGTPTATRLDPTLNFGWSDRSPIAGVGANNWSANWQGSIQAPTTGAYTLTMTSNDGARLWLNGQLVIDGWAGYGPRTLSATVNMTAGQKIPLLIRYFQDIGGSEMQLFWQSQGVQYEIVPSTQLYPPGS